MPTRRHFLQWAGGAAALPLVASRGFADNQSSAKVQPPDASPKRVYELGLASYTLQMFPLEQVVSIANRVGLKHLCLNPLHLPLDRKPGEIAAAAAKVRAAGLDLHATGGIDMSSPADVEQAFEYAKAGGMRIMIIRPLPKLLPLLDEKVRQYDIHAAIHNHGPDCPYYPVPDAAYEKIKRLDRRIGLCIDIGHTIRGGGDPIRAVEQFSDRVLEIHMKDIADTGGRAIEVGRGMIDIPRFLRTLDKIHYAGILSFEFEKDPNDPLPGLAESVGYVRGALAAIDGPKLAM
jgi:inosose dehydratase